MNRKQRREMERYIVSKGHDKAWAKKAVRIKEVQDSMTGNHLDDGTPVTLNVSQILSAENAKAKRRPDYIKFVTEHSGEVLHVKNRENHPNTSIVGLQEDPLWLFWVGDLTVVKERE